MKIHPLAELFPPMPRAQYEVLKASIQAQGLLEPITLLDSQVLDGKHRHRGCTELGIRPATRPFDGGDPLAYVLARNLQRRHLTETQRAMVAGKLARLK